MKKISGEYFFLVTTFYKCVCSKKWLRSKYLLVSSNKPEQITEKDSIIFNKSLHQCDGYLKIKTVWRLFVGCLTMHSFNSTTSSLTKTKSQFFRKLYVNYCMAFPINPKWTSLCGCKLPSMTISKYSQKGDCDIDLGIEAIVFKMQRYVL